MKNDGMEIWQNIYENVG